MHLPKVVIIGGGFGGLYAARALRDAGAITVDVWAIARAPEPGQMSSSQLPHVEHVLDERASHYPLAQR